MCRRDDKKVGRGGRGDACGIRVESVWVGSAWACVVAAVMCWVVEVCKGVYVSLLNGMRFSISRGRNALFPVALFARILK